MVPRPAHPDGFSLDAGPASPTLGGVTVETFQAEMEEALRAYDKFIVCLEKSTGDCHAALHSLLTKAIAAYESREPGLRHGIALDHQITVILSQSSEDRPHCAIYFNLHSPYRRQLREASVKADQNKQG